MNQEPNMLDLLSRMVIDDTISRRVQSRLHVTEDMIKRLGLEKELEGHAGCVNCLDWDESGSILASASDDFRVILWDPFRHKQLKILNTNHHGNIFTVKFMPKLNNQVVVTGAGDYTINVHDVPLSSTTMVCSCHTNRVKRLATVPDCPNMVWSASEDGTIRQIDLRRHSCTRGAANVLIPLRKYMGHMAEAKCLSINPLRPELIAVGANDPFVRLYDRRMIRTTSLPEFGRDYKKMDNIPEGCVQYFVAGHLPSKLTDYHKKCRSLVSTYLTFGSEGRDILVNLGGEQIYLFDIYNQRKPQTFEFEKSPYYRSSSGSDHGPSNGFSKNSAAAWLLAPAPKESTKDADSVARPKLPARVEALRLSANKAFEEREYATATRIYNEALKLYPTSSVLFGNRAAALMKRGWDGDTYAALRDCQRTLELEPNHFKAHFRMVRCLLELQWTKQASDCLRVFKNKFPSHAEGHACRALEKDINRVLQANSSEDAPQSSDSKNSGEPCNHRTFDSEETEEFGENSASAPVNGSCTSPADNEQEMRWQKAAVDFEQRFCGHCNTTTDIKEANFFGNDGQYIVAGSDDGSIYFWDRASTNNIRILKGDGSIVNCLQPHRSSCLLASSGIDNVVRLWSPMPEDGRKEDREVCDRDDAANANQNRMKAHPFEVVLMNMGYRLTPEGEARRFEDRQNVEFVTNRSNPSCHCRPS